MEQTSIFFDGMQRICKLGEINVVSYGNMPGMTTIDF